MSSIKSLRLLDCSGSVASSLPLAASTQPVAVKEHGWDYCVRLIRERRGQVKYTATPVDVWMKLQWNILQNLAI
jgi:hypothetical protein